MLIIETVKLHFDQQKIWGVKIMLIRVKFDTFCIHVKLFSFVKSIKIRNNFDTYLNVVQFGYILLNLLKCKGNLLYFIFNRVN